jgi:hypothetical protein
MKRYLTCSVPILVLSLFSQLPAWAQTVPAEVTDVQSHALGGVEFTVSGNGATTGPTDNFGKTQIILPQGTQAGDVIVLVLKHTKPPIYIFYSPWGGRAVVPKPSGFVAIVLGTRGDRAALQNPKVLAAAIVTINEKNDKFRATASFPARATETLRAVAEEGGFNPKDLDAAIKGFLTKTQDPSIQRLGKAYRTDYPFPAAATGALGIPASGPEKQQPY